jgi:hypothetical protein
MLPRERSFHSFPVSVMLKGCNNGDDFDSDKLMLFSQFYNTSIEEPEEVKVARTLHNCTIQLQKKILETKIQVTSKVLFFTNNKLLFFDQFCLTDELKMEFLGESVLQIILRPIKKNDGVKLYKFKKNLICKKMYHYLIIQLPNQKIYSAIYQSLKKTK